jgi:transcriptional regulator PpsR
VALPSDPLPDEPKSVPFRKAGSVAAVIDDHVAFNLASMAGDVTLLIEVIDDLGIVRDVALSDADLFDTGLEDWLDRSWQDMVTVESRPKIDALLKSAGSRRWRQINHPSPTDDIPIKFVTLPTGRDGWLLAIGRNLRSTAALQQKLLQTQQAMERDYIRLRHAEARYRLLFGQSSEAVIVVEAATRRITEANPAAIALIKANADDLPGRVITSLFHDDVRDQVITMLGSVAAAELTTAQTWALADNDIECRVSATLFRQGRQAYVLIRLTPVTQAVAAASNPEARLHAILERMPDAFVLTNADLHILSENAAFLDLTQSARHDQVRNQPLGNFLGRPGIDLSLLIAQLTEHGFVSNFGTIIRNQFGSSEDIEVSAVAINDGAQACYGFTIRSVGRVRDMAGPSESITPSVDQLTELVGRVSLKEIVRESTDMIERLCIEAALTYTSDNRASAAEILGLSRQSLYSKLHRHGLVSSVADADGESDEVDTINQ